jgi:predicted Rossmann fold flavoprotein
MPYDVIVVGGGPAGLMACVAASANGSNVLLVDKGDKLGRKLGISGGGRCNVTNAKEMDDLIKHIPGNGRFLYSALSTFGNQQIMAFFEGLGIELKEEDNGRMFPVSDKASTVVNALINQVRRQGVEIKTDSPVDEVLFEDGRAAGVRLRTGESVRSRAVILAVGGKSVPKTGSTGDGYAWAEKAGHTITELYPTEVPITSNEIWIRNRELQGLSLRDVVLTVYNGKGKAVISHKGDMIFTHFGLSGPAALRCSGFVVRTLRDGKGPVTVGIDLFPGTSEGALLEEWLGLARAEPRKALRNLLRQRLPERLVPLMLRLAEADGETAGANVSKAAWQKIAGLCHSFGVSVNGTLSIEEAFITGGGVHVKEIDPKTLQSKLMPGLFFCGEILDIHGYTGGYNITAAFATGHCAGTAAAEVSRGGM